MTLEYRLPGSLGTMKGENPTFPLAHDALGIDTPGMAKKQSQTRTTDSKGRLTLGDAFANRTVIVEERGDEIVVRMARVIPEREAWLYENPAALASVRRGLKQARERKLTDGPNLKEAEALAKKLKDA